MTFEQWLQRQADNEFAYAALAMARAEAYLRTMRDTENANIASGYATALAVGVAGVSEQDLQDAFSVTVATIEKFRALKGA